YFSSAKKIAWKTGTSFGFRDGWAVGVNPDYAVGVWVGNADGEGRPGLTGTETAAPILFDLFSLLPGSSWFQVPYGEMSQIAVCSQSGQRASAFCENPDTVWVAQAGLQSPSCKYHRKIFLTKDRKYRVHSDCESISNMDETSWFILPPIQEFYFKSNHFGYRSLPPFRKDCASPNAMASMDLIYPKPYSRVFLPYELDGSAGSTVFEAAHRVPSATIFWHLDGNFVAATRKTHKLSLRPDRGNHTILLVDDAGESISRPFSVISTNK
ncbi:MAG TPA: hypothetical protein VKQ08_00825, partial [Cyclobacteriaceae bacterium]|nr:hypothetical protein [Cyclobacteriaceae bacterium]